MIDWQDIKETLWGDPRLGAGVGVIAGVITWIAAAFSVGWVFGIALGWIPGLIVAIIIGWVAWLLMPLILFGIGCGIFVVLLSMNGVPLRDAVLWSPAFLIGSFAAVYGMARLAVWWQFRGE